MSQRIYKYELPLAGTGSVETPLGATPLAAVHLQGRKPMLWFIVDTEQKEKVLWEVYVAVTGESLTDEQDGVPPLDKARYLGTFQLASPARGSFDPRRPDEPRFFVGHVFVMVPKGHKISAAGQAATGG